MPGTVCAGNISIARVLNETVPSKEKLRHFRDLLKKFGAQASRDRKKTIPWDRLSFKDGFEKWLFFHCPRVGVEYKYDGLDSVAGWDRRPFDVADQMELQRQFREFGRTAKWLSADWSFNEASNYSEVHLFDYVTGDRPISVGFSTGFNIDDKPVDAGLQQSIFETVLEGLGIRDEFEYCNVEDQRCLLPKRTHKPAKKINVSFNVDPFLFQNKTHEFIVTIGKGMTGRTSLTPFRIAALSYFSDRNLAIEFANELIELVKRAAGDPTSITIEYWFNAKSLDDEFAATRMKVVPCHSLLLDYRKGFDPLAPQEVERGDVKAYPLILLKKYTAEFAPKIPALALNAVHTSDGMCLELQSCYGKAWIEEAAKILGGKLEFWEGPPEDRWGWYSDPPTLSALQKSCNPKTGSTKTSNKSALNRLHSQDEAKQLPRGQNSASKSAEKSPPKKSPTNPKKATGTAPKKSSRKKSQ